MLDRRQVAAVLVLGAVVAGTAAAARADNHSLAASLRAGMPAARQIATIQFNPFLPGSPPVETVTGKVNYTVYGRETRAIAAFLARLSRIRASLIVGRQSIAADSGSTASGRVGRTLALQGFAALLKAVADVRALAELKGQMLEDAIRDAPQDAACFDGTGSCDMSARSARIKRQAAKRGAAISAYGRDRDAGMALLKAAATRLA